MWRVYIACPDCADNYIDPCRFDEENMIMFSTKTEAEAFGEKFTEGSIWEYEVYEHCNRNNI